MANREYNSNKERARRIKNIVKGGISESTIERIIEALFSDIVYQVRLYGEARVYGLGVFYLEHVEASTMRIPYGVGSSELREVYVPAYSKIKFKPFDRFKDTVNYRDDRLSLKYQNCTEQKNAEKIEAERLKEEKRVANANLDRKKFLEKIKKEKMERKKERELEENGEE